MSAVRNYVKNFKRYNKTNEAGFALALTAFAFVLFWGGFVGMAFFASGGTFELGWWVALPLVFCVLTAVHFLVRPIIAAHYSNK